MKRPLFPCRSLGLAAWSLSVWLATVSSENVEVRVPVGSDAPLRCAPGRHVSGDATEFVWETKERSVGHFRRGQAQLGQGFENRVTFRPDSIETSNFSITIQRIGESDEGVYSCYWRQGDGEPQFACSVFVQVIGTPPLILVWKRTLLSSGEFSERKRDRFGKSVRPEALFFSSALKLCLPAPEGEVDISARDPVFPARGPEAESSTPSNPTTPPAETGVRNREYHWIILPVAATAVVMLMLGLLFVVRKKKMITKLKELKQQRGLTAVTVVSDEDFSAIKKNLPFVWACRALQWTPHCFQTPLSSSRLSAYYNFYSNKAIT